MLLPLDSAAVLAESGCEAPPGVDVPDSPVNRALCDVPSVGRWFDDLPARLWDWVQVLAWPWLPLIAVTVAAVVIAVRAAHRAAWRHEAAAGYWVRLTPPRVLDPGQAGQVWDLLAALARRARQGRFRLARPPVSFEVHADAGGGLSAGLWVPAAVPFSAVKATTGHAWPGATVNGSPRRHSNRPCVAGRCRRWPGTGCGRPCRRPAGWSTTSC